MALLDHGNEVKYKTGKGYRISKCYHTGVDSIPPSFLGGGLILY